MIIKILQRCKNIRRYFFPMNFDDKSGNYAIESIGENCEHSFVITRRLIAPPPPPPVNAIDTAGSASGYKDNRVLLAILLGSTRTRLASKTSCHVGHEFWSCGPQAVCYTEFVNETRQKFVFGVDGRARNGQICILDRTENSPARPAKRREQGGEAKLAQTS